MIDTYWSDHCRHTTFGTEIDRRGHRRPARAGRLRPVSGHAQRAGSRRPSPSALWTWAPSARSASSPRALLTGLDESEEINACTVKCKVDVDGEEQDWLYLFKNETHNHPDGDRAVRRRGHLPGRRHPRPACRAAATSTRPCASPAPATRSHPSSETLPGKLPQRKLVTTRRCRLFQPTATRSAWPPARSTSCITPATWPSAWRSAPLWPQRLPTTCVARRPSRATWWCCWAAAPAATASAVPPARSKAHNAGVAGASAAPRCRRATPPEERKIQRLFRRGEATRLIKRCNDFGAGGVSVAIGELADGLRIDLNKVPKKYEGLDGTELAISESQERMAVRHRRLATSTSSCAMRVRRTSRPPWSPRSPTMRACACMWNGRRHRRLSAASSWQRNGAPKHAGRACGPGGRL